MFFASNEDILLYWLFLQSSVIVAVILGMLEGLRPHKEFNLKVLVIFFWGGGIVITINISP